MDSFFWVAMTGFLGGMLSFFSPCILPLVPGYICFAAGVGFETLADTSRGDPSIRRSILWCAAAFVLGFSLIFIAAGAGASALNPLILSYKYSLTQIAGIIIILLGLYVAGILRLSFLAQVLGRDYRFMRPHVHKPQRPGTQLGIAFVLGLAFAFGWTPCIGPILTGILALAAGRESLMEGISLLSLYAAGMGLPFMLAALATGHFLVVSSKIKRHIKWVQRIAGMMLIVTGGAILFGVLQAGGGYLLDWIPFLARLG